jgi:heat shock protein HslJ/membrane-bound inhibitor of C-type lysozyme
MNNKVIIIAVIALIIIIGSAFYFNKTETQADKITVASYSNGESTVEVAFNQAKDTVTFTQNAGGAITLPRAISASGARYANNDESIVFWEHQGEATISVNGVETFKGQIITDTPAGLPILGTWSWQKTVMPNGTVVTPKKTDVFSLTFASDGQVSGTTDCNSFSGSYSQPTTGAITFGPLASTKMFCEGSQETDFITPFPQVRTYMIADSSLTLKLKGGGTITFKKK